MINVGIIGASFARDAYLPAFAHIDGAKGSGLWPRGRMDSAQGRRRAARHHGESMMTGKMMLSEHALDLVCIATPTVDARPNGAGGDLHPGAHVLCEKPTAMNAGRGAPHA